MYERLAEHFRQIVPTADYCSLRFVREQTEYVIGPSRCLATSPLFRR